MCLCAVESRCDIVRPLLNTAARSPETHTEKTCRPRFMSKKTHLSSRGSSEFFSTPFADIRTPPGGRERIGVGGGGMWRFYWMSPAINYSIFLEMFLRIGVIRSKESFGVGEHKAPSQLKPTEAVWGIPFIYFPKNSQINTWGIWLFLPTEQTWSKEWRVWVWKKRTTRHCAEKGRCFKFLDLGHMRRNVWVLNSQDHISELKMEFSKFEETVAKSFYSLYKKNNTG